MGNTAVITQANYLPWRGYFDLFRRADSIITLDCVQYTRRDWRNRNIIKTSQGPRWLTIPVEVKGKYFQAVDETIVSDPNWSKEHQRAIEGTYKKAAGYNSESPWIFEMLESVSQETYLSAINHVSLKTICQRLGLDMPLQRCDDLVDRAALLDMKPTERLVALCLSAGATRYLSGPTARSYIDESLFADAGIEVVWMSYEGYPDYPQLWGPFDPAVSIIDLFLNTGRAAAEFLGCGR